MKGVIVQVGEPKSIALFNNGKIGAVPTPADCRAGMVIDVSYNRRKFIFLGFFIFFALLGVLLSVRFLCFSPIGYVQITCGQQANKTVSLELSYNYFERVIGAKPLNTFSVAPIMDMRIKGKSINDAYRTILETLDSSETLRSQNYITVRIAQDNLEKARKIEQGLALLADKSGNYNNRSITFELYTLELYQKTEPDASALPQEEQHGGPWYGEHRSGRRN
ncbi:hypothetical protein AGMMS50255_2600 [Spirochaetia bacterium]|nr:hypothetical protein AGMMS50255_2600 [Spirochaetia bacterium]